MVCNSGEEGECEWGADCAIPTHHKPIHTSISLPSGGGIRGEKEEMKEGMQMATELGTSGSYPALWGQGLVSLGHPSPLCFAQKQVVGIIVDSSALRDWPPLDVNQG